MSQREPHSGPAHPATRGPGNELRRHREAENGSQSGEHPPDRGRGMLSCPLVHQRLHLSPCNPGYLALTERGEHVGAHDALVPQTARCAFGRVGDEPPAHDFIERGLAGRGAHPPTPGDVGLCPGEPRQRIGLCHERLRTRVPRALVPITGLEPP
jgi:hypothetical protein